MSLVYPYVISSSLRYPTGPLILHQTGSHEHETVDRVRLAGDEIPEREAHRFELLEPGAGSEGRGRWRIPAFTHRTACGEIIWQSPWWGQVVVDRAEQLHPRISKALLEAGVARWCQKCGDPT